MLAFIPLLMVISIALFAAGLWPVALSVIAGIVLAGISLIRKANRDHAYYCGL